MPCDYKLYPKNWKAIRAEVMGRAGDRCECVGECGLHQPKYPTCCLLKAPELCCDTPVKWRCVEVHGDGAKWAKGKIILTIAHLNHKTKDNRRKNLKALCQRCHLRMDHKIHMAHAALTRDRKKGQMRFAI